MNIVHLIHSLDPKTGGVHSAVELLAESLNKLGISSSLSADPNYSVQDNEIIIAHGLWQWPGRRAKAQRVPYLLLSLIHI